MTELDREFAGISGVSHVADSERQFAAMMSAVKPGFEVDAVQHALEEGGIPEPDETLGKVRFNGKQEAVNVTPLQLRGAIGPDGILDRIMDQFGEGNGVALYHKTGESYGWTLLAGHEVDGDGGRSSAVQAINPRNTHNNFLAPHKLIDIIKESTRDEERPRGLARIGRKITDYLTGADLEPKPTTGIYAYAVNVESRLGEGHLAVIFVEDENDGEPEPAATYSTGQDKVSWPKADAAGQADQDTVVLRPSDADPDASA